MRSLLSLAKPLWGETGLKERFLILPLVISKGVTNLPTLVISILLIEIGASYGVAPAIAGQLNAVSSVLAVASALLMGLVSMRYDHRNILVAGLVLYAISSAACSLAGSLYVLLPLFALTGVARSMVDPMLNSLIGAHVPAERRTRALGYTIGGLAFIYLIGSLGTAYLARTMSWQATLLIVVAPISALTFLLVLYLVPRSRRETNAVHSGELLSAYRQGLSNRSVLACLGGSVVGLAVWNVYLVYYATFARQTFGLSATSASQLNVVFAFSYIAGSLLASRFAGVYGKKIVTVGSVALLSFFSLFGMSVQFLPVSVTLGLFNSFFAGVMITAITSLTLDQMPRLRGTVMSLQSASVSLGSILATVAGGVLITAVGYGFYGIVMGCLGFGGAMVFHLYSSDPLPGPSAQEPCEGSNN
jgi:DHA1 family inner membrane transport protein